MSDAWVPVKLRVRHVCEGDFFVSAKAGDVWMVVKIESKAGRPLPTITAQRGPATHEAELDLDEILAVLVPVPERDALRVCRDELGARLAQRSTRARE